MQELRNKVAVITGAASGIGRALAEAFSKEGARIVIADIEVEALRVAEQQLRGSGAEVVAVRTDVGDSKSRQPFQRPRHRRGRVEAWPVR
jgi:NAD(P)-dependent dehydrogenase (short-subunit alcohol dehydrogenase family)